MCGIVALFSQTGPIDSAHLAAALDVLAHRGPDGATTWLSPAGRVGLGHRRLSIIDVATGAQPIASEDGQIQIIVNGEFYDFERVRCELIGRGHVFRTGSDSEIAVHLYQEFGTNMLDHLRGEFAFVLWDGLRQQLVAGRDRFGIKPLFYTDYQGTLYLASEAKALFAAGVPAAWDCESLYRQLFLCYAPDHSLFRGVRQLPPGHLLIANAAGHRLKKYWDFSFPTERQRRARETYAERVERVRELLGQAVELRLRADVPVGVMLSGGLDSTTVLGFATVCGSKPPTAFTIAFEDRAYDESSVAAQVARHYGADFHCIRVTEQDVVEHMQASGWHGEMVQYNAHGTARYLLSRAIHDAGYKVVLGGEGADEVFAGYEIMRAATGVSGAGNSFLRLLLPFARLASGATPAQRGIAETSPWLAHMLKLTNVPPHLQTILAERMALLRGLLSPDLLSEFREIDPYRDLFDRIQGSTQLLGREYARQVTYIWLKTFFANYHLGADRLDMAHSVETRLPFLDHPLFEYVSQLPVAALTEPGREKTLLREAAKPFIPQWIYNRPKKGFMAPPIDFCTAGPLNQFVQAVLRGYDINSVPFFNAQAINSTLDAIPSMSSQERTFLDPILMLFTSITLLHTRFRL